MNRKEHDMEKRKMSPKALKICGVLFTLTWVLATCACGTKKMSSPEETKGGTYVSITQQEAKNIMDTEENVIVLDVRSQEEYDAGHIANAILIPHDEIDSRAEAELPDKGQTILVYCRSGNRSKIASQALADLGYTGVKEFGGINTWEYGTVK